MRSAVLLITYRRHSTAERVFESIRSAQPPVLYFASNGPNPDSPGEVEQVELVRSLTQQVDWPCEVKTLMRDEHLDVRASVAGAIDWFFANETEGIVLEDDCVPSPDFFLFCDEMLDRFRQVDKVAVISGTCRQPRDFSISESYYFSKYVHIWGWATWRRTWDQYDRNLSFWPEWRQSHDWRDRFKDRVEERYWRSRFDATHGGETVTWDYQLMASVWKSRGLTVTPAANLVSNIGFGDDATFTKDTHSPLSAMPTFGIFPLAHPKDISANDAADRFDFNYRFNGRKDRFPARVLHAAGKYIRQRVLDPIYIRVKR